MKILGSDFDGTLNYMGIDDEKLKAIALWREKGNKFGIVSGRGHSFLWDLPREHGIGCDYLIAYNGGMVLTPEKEVLYSKKCFDIEQIPFVAALFSYGCSFAHVFSDNYFRYIIDEKEKEENEFYLSDKSAPTMPFFYQISVQLKDLREAERVVDLIKKDFGEKLTPLQNGICIDIVPNGINKAQGLLKVAEIFCCEKENIISVGDDYNDLDMIKAFRSYAMENGAELIKESASFITKSVTELIYKEL